MDIKSKIEQIQYEYERRKVARKLTGNLGKAVIRNNTIFCHVDKKSIERKRRINFGVLNQRVNAEIMKKYNFENTICFIVEDVDFQKGLTFFVAKHTQVTFRHCKFRKHIEIINSAGEVIFRESDYFQEIGLSHQPFFNANIRSIKFIDEYLINSGNKAIDNSSFSTRIEAENIFFCDTLLYAETGNAYIDITTDTLSFANTTINCPKIHIQAEYISTNSSTIYATDFVMVENKELDSISMIEAPEVIYNGQEITVDEGKGVVIREDTIDLIRKRIELLETLRNHLHTCTNAEPDSTDRIVSEDGPKVFSLK